MGNEDCIAKFYKGFPVTDRMMCAWKRSTAGVTVGDTCGGDSGGRAVLLYLFSTFESLVIDQC